MTGLTKEQKSRAINKEDMPPCDDCKIKEVKVLIKGFDGKLRCDKCHRKHMDKVYKESGDSTPNTSPIFKPAAKILTADQIRRQEIIKRYMRR